MNTTQIMTGSATMENISCSTDTFGWFMAILFFILWFVSLYLLDRRINECGALERKLKALRRKRQLPPNKLSGL